MTRRERLTRIVEWFEDRRSRRQLDDLIAKRGLTILTDEAMEELARRCVADYRFGQKLNRENRARRVAQEAVQP